MNSTPNTSKSDEERLAFNKKVTEHLAAYIDEELDLSAIISTLPDAMNEWSSEDIARAIIYCYTDPDGVFDMLEDKHVDVASFTELQTKQLHDWVYGSNSILALELLTEIVQGAWLASK